MMRSTTPPSKEAPPYPIKDNLLAELASKKLIDLYNEKKIHGPHTPENCPQGIYKSPVFVKEKDLTRNKILFLIDFSSPEGDSINSAIPKKHTYIEFPRILFWLDLINEIGPLAYITIADLQNAYYNVFIMAKFRKLFAFEWKNRIFMPFYMPFGVATGCSTLQKLLDIIFKALEITLPEVYTWNGRPLGTHYLDDACWISLFEQQAWLQVTIYFFVVSCLGLPIHPSKIQFPSKTGILLGFKLEIITSIFSLKESKAEKYLKQIHNELANIHKACLKKSRSIIGRLRHASRAIHGGFLFVRSFEEQVTKLLAIEFPTYKPYTHNKQSIEDLKCWTRLLPMYNGLPIEYLTRSKIDVKNILFTDASGNKKLGFGAWDSYGNWCSTPWSLTLLKNNILVLKNYNNILEFLTVAVAILATKKISYKNKSIHVLCDNETAVTWLIKKAPKFDNKFYKIIMHVLRELSLYCIKHKIYIWYDSVGRENNKRADALSNLNTKAFRIPQDNPSVKDVVFNKKFNPIKCVNSFVRHWKKNNYF